MASTQAGARCCKALSRQHSHVIELFRENLVRGRALLVRSLMKAQMAAPGFAHVYAGLIAVINSKMPEIGELLVKRVINQFRRAFKRNDKVICTAVTRFIAHLVNQQVAHEIIALQMLTLLLEDPWAFEPFEPRPEGQRSMKLLQLLSKLNNLKMNWPN